MTLFIKKKRPARISYSSPLYITCFIKYTVIRAVLKIEFSRNKIRQLLFTYFELCTQHVAKFHRKKYEPNFTLGRMNFNLRKYFKMFVVNYYWKFLTKYSIWELKKKVSLSFPQA